MTDGSRLRNDLYCVEWDVKLYYTISHAMTDAETDGLTDGHMHHCCSIVSQRLERITLVLKTVSTTDGKNYVPV